MNLQKQSEQIWIFAESFPTVVSELPQPITVFSGIIFCRLVLGVQSSCRTSSTIGKIAPTARPKKETNIASTRSSLITCKYCLSTLFLQLEQGNTSTFQLPFLRQHIQTLDHYIPYQFERIPLWRPCKKKNSKTYRNCPRANLLSWCQDLQYGSPPYPAQGYP